MMDRKTDLRAEIIGEKVIINTDVKETVDFDECKSIYNGMAQKLYKIKDAIEAGRMQLKKIEEYEKDEEMTEFVTKLKKANEILEREKLVATLKDLEMSEPLQEKEIERLAPIIKKINEMKTKRKGE